MPGKPFKCTNCGATLTWRDTLDGEGAFLASLETGSLNDIELDRAGALYTLTADKVRKYEITLPAPK